MPHVSDWNSAHTVLWLCFQNQSRAHKTGPSIHTGGWDHKTAHCKKLVSHDGRLDWQFQDVVHKSLQTENQEQEAEHRKQEVRLKHKIRIITTNLKMIINLRQQLPVIQFAELCPNQDHKSQNKTLANQEQHASHEAPMKQDVGTQKCAGKHEKNPGVTQT